MTLLDHIVCPFGIVRGIIILAIARLLLSPLQAHIFTFSSRLDAFLFIAGVLDILSRSTGLLGSSSEANKIDNMANLKQTWQRIMRSLFLSDHGGQILVPVWLGCAIVYLCSLLITMMAT